MLNDFHSSEIFQEVQGQALRSVCILTIRCHRLDKIIREGGGKFTEFMFTTTLCLLIDQDQRILVVLFRSNHVITFSPIFNYLSDM